MPRIGQKPPSVRVPHRCPTPLCCASERPTRQHLSTTMGSCPRLLPSRLGPALLLLALACTAHAAAAPSRRLQDDPDKPSASTAVRILSPVGSKLELSAGELGLTLRPATLADVNNITQAHTRFEMEMAAWSPDAEQCWRGMRENGGSGRSQSGDAESG